MSDYQKQHDDVAAVVPSRQITELRTYKSISMDIYRNFSESLRIKYHNDEKEINKHEDDDFDRIVFLGLQKWKDEVTGYEIIHCGKPADKRVLKKLGRIAYELLNFYSYPNVDGSSLLSIFNKSLGVIDKRTFSDYRKTILYYCNCDEQIIDRCKDSRLGELNVSGFVIRIPHQFIKGDLS